MKAYPDYKETNLEWLSQVPNEWNYSPIKFLLRRKISDGPHESPTFIDEGIPFLSVDGIQNGELIFENCRYVSEDDHNRFQQKCSVEKNDVLMGKAASIGKIARVKVSFDFSVWSPLAIIKPNKAKLFPVFLEYSLKSIYSQDQIEIYATSNTQKNISMDDIQRIQIVYPPLPEQEAIADFLDRKTKQIDELISKKQCQINLLHEQRTALINQAVTKGLNPDVPMKDSGVEWLGEIPSHWYIVPTRRIIDVRDGTHDTPEYIEPSEKSFPFVTSKDFEGDTINFDGTKHISTVDHELFIQRSRVDNGDVLMSMIGGNIGKALLVPNNTDFSIKNVALFKTHGNLALSKYILYYIRSGLLNIQIELQSKGGAQSFLSLTDIRSLLFFKMPQEEYEAITKYLDERTEAIEKQLQLLKKGIDLISEYRTALISATVTGKIDVRENK